MTNIDKRQLITLFKEELNCMILPPVILLFCLGLGYCMDRLFEMLFVTDSFKEMQSFLVWIACSGFCGFIGFVSYGEDLAQGTMPFLATRPVSHRRLFIVRISCGLIVSFLLCATGKILFLVQTYSNNEYPWSSWIDSFELGWWYMGPCAYLAALTGTLAAPSLVIANVMAYLLSFLVFWQGEWFSLLFLVLCPGLFILNERLAYYRRTTQWSELK